MALPMIMESVRGCRRTHGPACTHSESVRATVRENSPHTSPPFAFLSCFLPQGLDLDEMPLLMGTFDGGKTTTWNIACVSSRKGGKCQGHVSGRGCFSLDCAL